MQFEITMWFVIIFGNLFSYIFISNAEVLTKLPATLELIKELGSAVCLDLVPNPINTDQCTENFQRHLYETDKEPPSVEVKCQSESKLTFAVPQSKDWQLVIVLPHDEVLEYIPYNILEPAKEFGSVYTPQGNFTVWTALVAKNGNVSLWKKGPDIKAWDPDDYEEKTYDVEAVFLYDKMDGNNEKIDVQINWNTTDSSDSCFYVYNHCNSDTMGNTLMKRISPDKNRTVIATVPLDDRCSVKIKGKYGTTTFFYDTPACHKLQNCKTAPEYIKGLNLSAEDVSGKWKVYARWNRPTYDPLYYNVTLRADKIYTVNVTGNATEAIFIGVDGDDFFNVTVEARNLYGRAVSTRRGIFPYVEESAVMGVFEGVWAGMLVLWTAFVIIIVWWKRQRNLKKRNMYFPGVQGKPSKDGDIEVCSVESGSEDQWEVKPERLLLHEVIGEGAFGVVRRGTLSPDNKDVAVKMLKDFPSVEEIRSFRAEMELMKSVGCHPHVVSLVGCCRGRKPFIIAEYCSRGDLLTYLRCSWDLMVTRHKAKYYNNNEEDYRDVLKKADSRLVINKLYDLQGICDTELTVLDLLSFCRQIAMGMEFLASNRVVHRDLAARNILVTADRTLKIADFGLSRDIYQENQYKQKGNGKMPVKWMALESLTHRIYTTQSDVWSFGVVMWEIVTMGGAPYPEVPASRLPRLLRAGYRMRRPSNCSVQLYELMVSCWHERPRSRPTFGELHRALDALLCARAHHYLELQLPDTCATLVKTNTHRYVRMIMRGKWPWSRGYQRSYTTNYTPRTEYKLANSMEIQRV